MNENLNLVEILKDCPAGTQLYSPVYGYVELVNVYQGKGTIYPIVIKIPSNSTDTFTCERSFDKDGRLFADYNGECLLFPSRDQRDWSKFDLKKPKFKVGDKIVNIPRKDMGASGTQGIISKITDDKYIFTDGSYILISDQGSWELVHDKKPKFDPKTFQPFDKVLVKRGDKSYHAWFPDFVSLSPNDIDKTVLCMTTDDVVMVIPYNEETKCIAGTNKEAPEFYRYWEDY